jgi:hypothetical protein
MITHDQIERNAERYEKLEVDTVGEKVVRYSERWKNQRIKTGCCG